MILSHFQAYFMPISNVLGTVQPYKNSTIEILCSLVHAKVCLATLRRVCVACLQYELSGSGVGIDMLVPLLSLRRAGKSGCSLIQQQGPGADGAAAASHPASSPARGRRGCDDSTPGTRIDYVFCCDHLLRLTLPTSFIDPSFARHKVGHIAFPAI